MDSQTLLLTIIFEPVLLGILQKDIEKFGATGITITEVKGEGSRHAKSSEIPSEKLKLECLAEREIVEKILQHVAKEYFENYSLITYATEVTVVRSEKFMAKQQERI